MSDDFALHPEAARLLAGRRALVTGATTGIGRGTVFELAAHGAAVDEGEGDAEVTAEEGLAARMGITGVPFFLAARAVALSGAHEPEALKELLAAGRQSADAAA